MKMRFYFLCLVLLALFQSLTAQDSVRHRFIVFGNGSSTTPGEEKLLLRAVSAVRPGRTTVLMTGDNKWLNGNPGSKKSKSIENARASLIQTYRAFREKGATLLFTTGNSEWNSLTGNERKMPLKAEADSLQKIMRDDHCPDPIEVIVTDSIAVILFKSRFWLNAEELPAGHDCSYTSKAAVLARLDELRYKHRNKFVFFVSSHPLESYGVHGSNSTWKDHLFPLTGIQKHLYLPMPVVGSIFRFFRSAFAGPGNSKHPLYKDMQSSVGDIFSDYPNLVYIAGREPGLQLLQDRNLYMVNGGTAGTGRPQKGKYTLFSNARGGYVVADLLLNNTIRFDFFSFSNDSVPVYTHRLPFTQLAGSDTAVAGQVLTDSLLVQAHAAYDKVGGLRRMFFGENYRKEWAAPTMLPVIRISNYKGGLTPVQRGGGMQSKSLRLVDKDSNEWVIRSVEKSPDALLPENFRKTFARDWVDDATSAQHPYAALVVPPIANAVNVPHAHPVIGVIAPDRNLGIHGRVFANMVALVEEREPLGDSDNSEKMKRNLKNDNDNRLMGERFLDARMLDMLLGDWDRHEDQWRWKDQSKGKRKTYLGIPRDRDQVFHLTKGIIPKIASRDYILPTLRNFDKEINHEKWVIYKTKFVNAYPDFQLSRPQWKKQAEAFQAAITDSVLEAALRRLPESAYKLRHETLLDVLKARRARLPAAMDAYYRFTQKIVDIQLTDKNEWVQVTGTTDGGLHIRISKLSRSGKIEDELMNKTYDPALTKEIRIYLFNGADSVQVNNSQSPIRVRIIGGKDVKAYSVITSRNRIRLYDHKNMSRTYDEDARITRYISDDSLHTTFVPVNLYNVWQPLTVFGLNLDDGFILGAGFKHTRQEGFRKIPFSNTQQLVAAYSFSTGAYRIRYSGEWRRVFRKTDLVVQAIARAPNNTVNFFGRGNNTAYNKTGDHKRFYRTRYSTYIFEPALRWGNRLTTSFTAGPSFYFYAFDKEDNKGRFIQNTLLIGSYDSVTISESKVHGGVVLQFTNDRRNNKIFPQWGSYLNIRLQAYKGMSDQARSFAQLIPELAVYKSLTRRSTIVLAERLGGVIGLGDAAFYQSAYLGGHENLFGYRQYRFAGRHSFYNNLELRIKLADIVSYILPGQFGIIGFWDTGRVWERHDNSDKWHNGTGGGIYFAPASVIALSFVAGHSSEGWYPYFTLGLRF